MEPKNHGMSEHFQVPGGYIWYGHHGTQCTPPTPTDGAVHSVQQVKYHRHHEHAGTGNIAIFLKFLQRIL